MWAIASTIAGSNQQPLSSSEKVNEDHDNIENRPDDVQLNQMQSQRFSQRTDLFRIDFFIDGVESIGNTLNLPYAPMKMEWFVVEASSKDESSAGAQ